MKKIKGQLTPVEEVLQAVFEGNKSPLSDGFIRWKLEKNWSSVVSAAIAKNSRPLIFDKGCLIIEVSNASWANELQYFCDLIVGKVNEFVGKKWIYKIRFVQKGFSQPDPNP